MAGRRRPTAAAAADMVEAEVERLERSCTQELFALLDKRSMQERRAASVLSTREWIERAKANLSGRDHVGEEEFCSVGRLEVEGHKEAPSMIEAVNTLPFHLIFCRLPLRQLFQLRCVCKHWNSILRGAALAYLDLNKEQEEYWFVMSQPIPPDERIWNFRAFSSQDWAFFGLPLPGYGQGKLSELLGGMGCSLLPHLEDIVYVGRCRPRLVSAGGLMCAFVHKADALDDYSVIVFNCLTGSVKVLPPLQDPHYLSSRPGMSSLGCATHMMAVDEQDPTRYYVLLTHEKFAATSREFYVEVFDSRKGCWTVGPKPTVAIEDSKVQNADFFFGSASYLLGYNASDDVWSKILVAKISGNLGWPPTFLKYKGRVLQGCWLSRRDNICLGFVVWELRPTAFSDVATWVEVARTPQHLWEGISRDDWDVVLRAEGSLFYMAFEDYKLQGQFRPPLVYDIAQNLWYFLPSESGSTNFGCISVLRPRLSRCLLHIEGGEQI